MPNDAEFEPAMETRISAGEVLYSPSAARNSGPIAHVLVPRLGDSAHILEIGSGTGEHAEAVIQQRSDITWQPTDIDPTSLASQAARANMYPDAMRSPLRFDAADQTAFVKVEPFDTLVCSNVIHISPWRVAEGLAELAGQKLRENGFVFLYGPFLEGSETAPSNLEFDASLKSRNSEWGVRPLSSVVALFAAKGFDLTERIEMPANNLSLIWRRVLA